jgi:hypothetical protein
MEHTQVNLGLDEENSVALNHYQYKASIFLAASNDANPSSLNQVEKVETVAPKTSYADIARAAASHANQENDTTNSHNTIESKDENSESLDGSSISSACDEWVVVEHKDVLTTATTTECTMTTMPVLVPDVHMNDIELPVDLSTLTIHDKKPPVCPEEPSVPVQSPQKSSRCTVM